MQASIHPPSSLNPKQVALMTDTSLGKEERKEGREGGQADGHPARNLIEINGQIFGCRPAEQNRAGLG